LVEPYWRTGYQSEYSSGICQTWDTWEQQTKEQNQETDHEQHQEQKTPHSTKEDPETTEKTKKNAPPEGVAEPEAWLDDPGLEYYSTEAWIEMDTSTKGEPKNDQNRLESRTPTKETQNPKTPEDEADVEHTQDAKQSSDLGCPPDQHHHTCEEDTKKGVIWL
jgi:hypothetical protein